MTQIYAHRFEKQLYLRYNGVYYFETDAGRHLSSHPKEKDDCTVRTVALAFNWSYDKAHAFLKKCGRKNRRGIVFFDNLPKTIDNKKLKLVNLKKFRNKLNYGNFSKHFPDGIFMVEVDGHVFTVKDGIIYDDHLCSKHREIINVCELDCLAKDLKILAY